jgi:hypothetical protein
MGLRISKYPLDPPLAKMICAGEDTHQKGLRTGTKGLAYWYKSTNSDTDLRRRGDKSACVLVQRCLLTGTKVQILTLLCAGEEMGVAEDALGTRLWHSIYLLY